MESYPSQTVTEYFYHLETDTTGRYTKEWLINLTGTFVYDPYTRLIHRASSPSLSIEVASFGSCFTPYITNVSTSYSISSSGTSVTFSGRHNMRATLEVPIGDLPIGFDLNFGNHSDSFIVTAP